MVFHCGSPGRAVVRRVDRFLCRLWWWMQSSEESLESVLPGPGLGQTEPDPAGAGGDPGRQVHQPVPDGAGPSLREGPGGLECD